MKPMKHYPDADKDNVHPGARNAARREQEKQRARDRMNAVDPSESTRRMNETAQREGNDIGGKSQKDYV